MAIEQHRYIMKKIFKNLLLMMLIGFVYSFAFADNTKFSKELDQIRLEFDTHKQIVETKLDANDKRIADFSIHTTAQGTQTAWVSNLIAMMALGITVVSIVAGFAIYNGAAAKAKNEARNVAESWFNDNSTKIQNRIAELEENANRFHLQITELEEKALSSLARMDRDSERVTAAATSAENAVKHAAERLISKSISASSKNRIPNTDDQIVIKQANDVLKQKPENNFSASDHYIRGVSFFTAGNFQNALESFTSAIDLSKYYIFTERAKYLMAKATVLSRLDRDAESIEILDEILQLESDFLSDDPTVIQSLVNKAVSLNKLGRFEEEVAAYNIAISKFNNNTDTNIVTQLVKAIHYKALTLGLMSKPSDALELFNDAIKRFKDNPNEQVRDQLIKLMFGKAVHQMKQKDFADEISTYDEIIEILDGKNPNSLDEQVVKAKHFKAMTLSSTDRVPEALEMYQILESSLKQNITPELKEILANIMLGKARCLDKLKRTAEELAMYEEIQDYFNDDSSTKIRNIVARSSWLRGLTIEGAGDGDGALNIYQELAKQFESDKDPSIRETRIAALGASMRILRAKNKITEEETLYLQIENQYSYDETPQIQFRLAEILSNRIEKVISSNEPEKFIEALNNLIARFGKEKLSATREIIATNIEKKIRMLKKINRDEDANKIFESMDSDFKNETSPIIQKIISRLREEYFAT